MGYRLTTEGQGTEAGHEDQADKAPPQQPGLAFPGYRPLVARRDARQNGTDDSSESPLEPSRNKASVRRMVFDG